MHRFKRFFLSYRTLPHKKQYLEFFTALLSIPVLLTVIILNLNTLRSNKDAQQPAPVQQEKIIVIPSGNQNQSNNTAVVTQGPCKQQIGPIQITSPQEGDIITDSPVYVTVAYTQGTYCSVVWSYRINGGKWSEYDDKSIALYNLPLGDVKLELRVKSVVTNEQKTLTRNFTYEGTAGTSVTPTSTQVTPTPVH